MRDLRGGGGGKARRGGKWGGVGYLHQVMSFAPYLGEQDGARTRCFVTNDGLHSWPLSSRGERLELLPNEAGWLVDGYEVPHGWLDRCLLEAVTGLSPGTAVDVTANGGGVTILGKLYGRWLKRPPPRDHEGREGPMDRLSEGGLAALVAHGISR